MIESYRPSSDFTHARPDSELIGTPDFYLGLYNRKLNSSVKLSRSMLVITYTYSLAEDSG